MIEQIGILSAESDHSLLIRIIRKGNIEDIRIKKTLAFFAENEEWKSLWSLADVLQREVSVLFDNEENIWVDIGTRGEVRMSPPTGAKIPFKMWIHTHPYDAYWSITDLETLACFSSIMEIALVLGHDHYKLARKITSDEQKSLDEVGPLRLWTNERIKKYDEEMI